MNYVSLSLAGCINTWPWTAASTEENVTLLPIKWLVIILTMKSSFVSSIKPSLTEGFMLSSLLEFYSVPISKQFLNVLILLLLLPVLFLYVYCSCNNSCTSNMCTYAHSTHVAHAVEEHSFQDWQLIFYLLHTSIQLWLCRLIKLSWG